MSHQIRIKNFIKGLQMHGYHVYSDFCTAASCKNYDVKYDRNCSLPDRKRCMTEHALKLKIGDIIAVKSWYKIKHRRNKIPGLKDLDNRELTIETFSDGNQPRVMVSDQLITIPACFIDPMFELEKYQPAVKLSGKTMFEKKLTDTLLEEFINTFGFNKPITFLSFMQWIKQHQLLNWCKLHNVIKIHDKKFYIKSEGILTGVIFDLEKSGDSVYLRINDERILEFDPKETHIRKCALIDVSIFPYKEFTIK